MINVKFDSSGFKDAISKAMAKGVEESIKKTIKPFENEIKKHGGRVTIIVPKNLKDISIKFNDVPDELLNRIKKAFK